MHEPYRPGLARLLTRLDEIVESVSTPFYAYDWPSLENAVELLIDSADRAGLEDRLRLYPALFALPNIAIFRRLLALDKRIGVTCNTVEEVRALRALGFSEWPRAVFSGGVVGESDLREIAETGMIVNAASVGNVDKLARFPVSSRIGLRLDLYNDALKGIREPELPECLRLLQARGRRVEAMHAYRGTQVTDSDVLLRHAQLVLDAACRLEKVAEVNFGGGFPYDYESRTGQPFSRIDFSDYFSAIRDYAVDRCSKFGGLLAWEPGRVLFAGAGFFVAEVLEVRRRGTATADFYLDASFAQMPSPKLLGRQHHAVVLSPDGEIRQEPRIEARLCGCTTLSSDLLLPHSSCLATAHPGDRVVIFDAGAYGRSGSYNFLGKALPPEILLNDNGWTIVRQRGQTDYLANGLETDGHLRSSCTLPGSEGLQGRPASARDGAGHI